MRSILLVLSTVSTIVAQTNYTEIWSSGRKVANPAEFPFLVVLATKDNQVFCSGSIVKPRWVLTSGYCLIVRQSTEILVFAGDNDPREVESLVTYPDFPEFDLGLLKVKAKFQWSDFVEAVTIGNVLAFERVLAVGWGLEGSVFVKQVTNDKCLCDKVTVCASNQEDEECVALIGGPLIGTSSGKLVGILTTNSTCGDRGTNFVYTRAHVHFSWIYVVTLN